jgi:hypothetical protein
VRTSQTSVFWVALAVACVCSALSSSAVTISGERIVKDWAAANASLTCLRLTWVSEGMRLPDMDGKPGLRYQMERLAYRWPGAIRVDLFVMTLDDVHAQPPLLDEKDFSKPTTRTAVTQPSRTRVMTFGGSDGLVAYEKPYSGNDELRGAFRTPWLAARWVGDQVDPGAVVVKSESSTEVVAVLGKELLITLRYVQGEWRCEKAQLAASEGAPLWEVDFSDFRKVDGVRALQPYLRVERRKLLKMPGSSGVVQDSKEFGPDRMHFVTSFKVETSIDDSTFVLTEEEAKAETAAADRNARERMTTYAKQIVETKAKADAARIAAGLASAPLTQQPQSTPVAANPADRKWYFLGGGLILACAVVVVIRLRRA